MLQRATVCYNVLQHFAVLLCVALFWYTHICIYTYIYKYMYMLYLYKCTHKQSITHRHTHTQSHSHSHSYSHSHSHSLRYPLTQSESYADELDSLHHLHHLFPTTSSKLWNINIESHPNTNILWNNHKKRHPNANTTRLWLSTFDLNTRQPLSRGIRRWFYQGSPATSLRFWSCAWLIPITNIPSNYTHTNAPAWSYTDMAGHDRVSLSLGSAYWRRALPQWPPAAAGADSRLACTVIRCSSLHTIATQAVTTTCFPYHPIRQSLSHMRVRLSYE